MAREYESPCYSTNLRHSANTVAEFYDRMLAPVGLAAGQYRLLINLRRLGSANISRWAEFVGLERSTMIRNVRPLEEKGWISLTAGLGKTYCLSDTGNILLDEAIPLWESAQTALREFLGDEDTRALMRISAKLQKWEP